MGDSGSLILGFCIGYCSIELILLGEIFLVISFLSYTFVDCTYTIVMKILNGNYPWARMFDYQFLKHGLSRSKSMIKSKLLDQSFIAGLGNIYVDESLWLAKIHPKKKIRHHQ